MNFKRQFLSREAAGELWPLPGWSLGGGATISPPARCMLSAPVVYSSHAPAIDVFIHLRK